MPDQDKWDHLERKELLALVREQEAALTTYKETLGRIYQEFDAKIEELSLIRRVADVLRQAEGLTGLGRGLLEVVMSESPADFVMLLLADSEMSHLRPVTLFNREWDQPRPVKAPGPRRCLPLGAGELGRAVAQGRVLIMPTLEAPLEPWPRDLPRRARSLLALPLVARRQTLGALVLVAHSPGTLGDEHARTLTIISAHAASALANVRLIDELGEINERLLASELEAHQAKEYLEHILDTASDLIVIADQRGRVNYVNQAAEDLGLDPEGLMGRPLASLFSDRARAERLFSRPDRRNEELELTAPNGELRHMLVSTTPLTETNEVLAILRDITHRRGLERQLMHAEKLASVGILAAGVAHEIGNPLSAISGYAQLLGKDEVSAEERREFAGFIVSQSERIDRIIRDLLDYSRPSPYQGQTVQVNQAIEAVLNMFFTSKRLANYNLDIKRDLGRNLPRVRIDRDQLQQVVLNMAMNAAQAMEEGGRLTISTGRREDWVKITFSDTGPGIAQGHLMLIFDPFFTTKQPGQGTGLGLSICDRIVSQAGGRIEVESALGRGTTFTVWLPAVREPERGE